MLRRAASRERARPLAGARPLAPLTSADERADRDDRASGSSSALSSSPTTTTRRGFRAEARGTRETPRRRGQDGGARFVIADVDARVSRIGRVDARGFAASALRARDHRPGRGGGGAGSSPSTTPSGGGGPAAPVPPLPRKGTPEYAAATRPPEVSLGGGGAAKPSSPSSSSSSSSSSVSTEPLPADDSEADAAVVVDLHALAHARAEIDRLHRERQLKEVESRWGKVVKAWESVKALGPYVASTAKMSPAEWKTACASTWHHFKDELRHYWMGTKLLWVEVKIARRLLFKTLRGEPLTRRERRQMTRTTADVFRLVPFAAFVLIPFMEFLLPVALKLFPSMLPTTFRNELKHEEELKKKLNAKLEVARFLQDTVSVMAKGLKQSRSGYTRERASTLYDFMKKVRAGDANVKNDDITRFAKLFKDEFTLDHISRGQLTNMCKLVGLAPYGTDTYLRYQLRNKLRELKQDDKQIMSEGVENMSVAELQSASRARGMRSDTHDRNILERQLKDWLELSLEKRLPPSLLVLSRAFTITYEEKEEATYGAGDVAWAEPDEKVDERAKEERRTAAMREIQDTIASLPEEVVISVTEERSLAQDRKQEVERKLEFLEQEEELIQEEIADQKLEECEVRAAEEKAKAAREAKEGKTDAEITIDAHENKSSSAAGGADEDEEAASAAKAKEAARAKPKEEPASPWIPIDSVSLDEVESVVAGRRAHRAAKLSRLLAALAGVSSLSVERKELMLLVRKELSVYAKRLKQVQKQLEGLEGADAMVAAVAAEGDVEKAEKMKHTAHYLITEEDRDDDDEEEEEERMPSPEELIPDEKEELKAASDAASDDVEDERLADPAEVVPDENPEVDDGEGKRARWFRANYDAELCDRVNDRVNRMLASVKKDLDASDAVIGEKFKVLDADGDGRISLEELTGVGGILAHELDEEDNAELKEILSSLDVDGAGRVDVADLSRLVTDLIAKEFHERESHDDDDHDEASEDDASGATAKEKEKDETTPNGNNSAPSKGE